MSWLSDIEKVDFRNKILYITLFVATVCPGFMFFAFVDSAVMKDLDVIKMIILSISVMVPILLANIVSLFFLKDIKRFNQSEESEKLLTMRSNLLDACLATFLVGYLSTY